MRAPHIKSENESAKRGKSSLTQDVCYTQSGFSLGPNSAHLSQCDAEKLAHGTKDCANRTQQVKHPTSMVRVNYDAPHVSLYRLCAGLNRCWKRPVGMWLKR